MKTTSKIVAAGLAVALAGAVIAGRDRMWMLVAGPADLGHVDFATLEPPASPNHFLACPKGYCRLAHADMVSPIFKTSAAQLQLTARRAWAAEPRLQRVSGSLATLSDRYVERTAIMRFPDTISVRFIDLGGGAATLAIYSRSQIGYSDLGVNKARVMHWLSLLIYAQTVSLRLNSAVYLPFAQNSLIDFDQYWRRVQEFPYGNLLVKVDID